MEAEEKDNCESGCITLQPPSRKSSASSWKSQPLEPLDQAGNYDTTCHLAIPGTSYPVPDPETSSTGSRRCSARMLSMNLQHTLRQLRREEHNARVSSLLKRNAVFYQRQRCCECITMLSVLSIFTCFSLYIVFAHGFHFGKEKPFNLVHNYTRKMFKDEGDTVEILCQADHHWEWCRWIHMDHFCDFEWQTYGVEEIGCDFPAGKVELFGDYDKHQCGLRIHNLDMKDRGIWMCEVEKYYLGFSRRYGEYRQNIINMVVQLRPTTTSTASTSSLNTGNPPTASALTPNVPNTLTHQTATTITTQNNSTTINPLTEKQEYERNFYYLRVFVLGTIGCVLSTLALMFWVYFMYLWKTWDSGNKRDSGASCQPNNILSQKRSSFGSMEEADPYAVAENEDSDDDNGDQDEENDEDGNVSAELDHHPHFDRRIMRSRRKSVSFAVCRMNPDTLQFDIEHKSVMLGAMSQHAKCKSAAEKPPVSPLADVARKWKDAKNKLVLKDRSILTSVVVGQEFEFKDDAFRSRRKELIEKAKALEKNSSDETKGDVETEM